MESVICVDVGSTFTKGLQVDLATGAVLAGAQHPTTPREVMVGVRAVREACAQAAHRAADRLLACSSAGGGLRIAVVGYEREVTAEAGRRVALTAGGRVVHISSGPLDATGIDTLRAARADLLVLVGGTDEGNSEVVEHNAEALARARIAAPILYAGNAAVRERVMGRLIRARRRVLAADNVLPEIGRITPGPAREAIRATFLTHVIAGKHLSSSAAFTRAVRGATPDLVLAGIEVLAEELGEVMLVDVGGATTDVYSVLAPTEGPAQAVVAELRAARSVEGDLGLRFSAQGVVEAAATERLDLSQNVRTQAPLLGQTPSFVPTSESEHLVDAELARCAVTIAARRHGRAQHTSEPGRALADVRLVIGSGGVLRHADPEACRHILQALVSDHGGGWQVPERARLAVDHDYVIFAIGLLAPIAPQAARRLAHGLKEARL